MPKNNQLGTTSHQLFKDIFRNFFSNPYIPSARSAQGGILDLQNAIYKRTDQSNGFHRKKPESWTLPSRRFDRQTLPWGSPGRTIWSRFRHLVLLDPCRRQFMGNTEQFERIAAHYDSPERIRIARVITEAIKSNAGITAGKTAIDFGCGTGLIGMDLRNQYETMVFLDTSPQMLQIVENKLRLVEAKNAVTRCVDWETADPGGPCADHIFAVQVLLHILKIEPLLQRLYDALNPDGELFLVDFDKNEQVQSDLVHNGFDQTALKDCLAKIGFTDLRSRTVYEGTGMFMGQDASLFMLRAKKPGTP